MVVNRSSGTQPARRPLAGAWEREGRPSEPPADLPRTPPPDHRDQGPPQADPRAAPRRRGVPKLAPQLGGREPPGREQRGGPRSTPARVEGIGTASGSGRGRPGRGGTGPEKPEAKRPPPAPGPPGPEPPSSSSKSNSPQKRATKVGSSTGGRGAARNRTEGGPQATTRTSIPAQSED
jgi:hypothetical protein